jgi:hypothetical protein
MRRWRREKYQMAGGDRVIAIGWVVPIESMVPFSSDGCTGWDVDDIRGQWLVVWVDTTIADDVVGVNIGDRLYQG